MVDDEPRPRHHDSAHPASLSAIVPGSTSGLRTDDLHRIAIAIDAEVAPSTRTTYASGWRSWETWCRRRGLPSLPADSDALAAYLTERAEAGLCSGTLDGDCAAIAHRHHQEGLGDPTAAAIVRRVRRGLRRILGTAPRRRPTRSPSPSSPTSWRASTQNLASASATEPSSCWDTRPRCVQVSSPHSIWRTSASAATACSSPFHAPRPTRRRRQSRCRPREYCLHRSDPRPQGLA